MKKPFLLKIYSFFIKLQHILLSVFHILLMERCVLTLCQLVNVVMHLEIMLPGLNQTCGNIGTMVCYTFKVVR